MGQAEGNATEAARIAGYGAPAQQGSRLLRSANVATAIDARRRSDPLIATREERQRFWTEVMKYEDTEGHSDMKDRLKASELLGKTQADFIERRELSGPGGAPLFDPDALLAKLKKLAE